MEVSPEGRGKCGKWNGDDSDKGWNAVRNITGFLSNCGWMTDASRWVSGTAIGDSEGMSWGHGELETKTSKCLEVWRKFTTECCWTWSTYTNINEPLFGTKTEPTNIFFLHFPSTKIPSATEDRAAPGGGCGRRRALWLVDHLRSRGGLCWAWELWGECLGPGVGCIGR